MSFSIRVHLNRFPRPKAPRRKRRGDEGEAVPAEPDKPKPLLGGAAAALEYDS